jgi:hypothetical protein
MITWKGTGGANCKKKNGKSNDGKAAKYDQDPVP